MAKKKLTHYPCSIYFESDFFYIVKLSMDISDEGATIAIVETMILQIKARITLPFLSDQVWHLF